MIPLSHLEPGTRCQVRTKNMVLDPCVVTARTADRLFVSYVRISFDERGRMYKDRKTESIPLADLLQSEGGRVRTYQEET